MKVEGTHSIGVPDCVGDIEHKREHDDGEEGDVELQESDKEEEDPSGWELKYAIDGSAVFGQGELEDEGRTAYMAIQNIFESTALAG